MSETAPSLIGIAEPTIVTADFGGTHSTILEGSKLFRPDLDIRRYPTPTTYRQAIEEIGARTAALLGRRKLDGFGFGVASKVVNGVITTAGQLTTYGWRDQEILQDIADVLDIDPS